jgi:hypothetical protein
MAQVDADDYQRLTGPEPVYGQSDGVFYKRSSGEIVVVVNGVEVLNLGSAGIEGADLAITGQARGDLLRRGASAWESLVAKTSGSIVLGDGTDVISAAMSGDATISAAGVITLTETLVKYATASIASADITGTSAGQLGHANGYEVVAAPGAGKVIEFVSGVVILDYATAAYTGGGDVTFNYAAGGGAVSAAVSYANSIGASADKVAVVGYAAPANNQLVANAAINLVVASAPTQPGTAAGVIRTKVTYRVHTTGL